MAKAILGVHRGPNQDLLGERREKLFGDVLFEPRGHTARQAWVIVIEHTISTSGRTYAFCPSDSEILANRH
jgi:hypothetical protein